MRWNREPRSKLEPAQVTFDLAAQSFSAITTWSECPCRTVLRAACRARLKASKRQHSPQHLRMARRETSPVKKRARR